MVIFLAPSGVGVISADLLNAGWSPAMMVVFGVAVAGFAIWLATRIGWLVAGGWTPAWGAFTFPTAALAGAAEDWNGGAPPDDDITFVALRAI